MSLNFHRWRHIFTLLLYITLTVALTWPIAAHLNDEWLADSTNDPDAFIKLWDIDYLGRMLHGEPGQTYFHTSLLFHPDGLDLTYHTFHVPHMLTAYALRPLLGLIGAFNATSLIMIVVTALSGYTLLLELLPHRDSWETWGAALFGGAVLGFSQWVMHNLRHPDLAFLATQALALLFMLRLLRGKSWLNGVMVGLMIGITAYVGLYILVVTGLMLAVLLAAALIQKRGRLPWGGLIVMGLVAAALALPRLLPMVTGNLNFALTNKYSGYYAFESVDVVNFFAPTDHPLLRQAFTLPDGAWRYHMFYLGWSVIALAFIGLIPRATRGRAAAWLFGAVFFMLLALGPRLNLNGTTYESVPMLKPLLDHVPVIFKAFGRPDNFLVGVTLPVAASSAFGLLAVLRVLGPQPEHTNTRRRILQVAVLGLVLLVACWERWTGPYEGSYPNRGQSAYYSQLAQETDDFAILELPLGRNPGKYYLYYQLTHRHPMVEGLASRTPDGAYNYIDASPMMTAWKYWKPLDCTALDLRAEFARLASDNVRYILLHHYDPPIKILRPYFEGVTPVYEDSGLSVYRTEDLAQAQTCP